MRIHTLDLQFQNTPGLIASYLIENDGEHALIETGPGSTLPALRAAIQAAGVDASTIRKVFVTHIHLDHSGAAGWFAQRGATIYCHPNAARHLIDPSKLIESARMVYGAQFDGLWGETLPAPAEKVIALADGESVDLGGTRITAWDTPGHARHHHAYVIGDACFTGDVAGMRLQGTNYLSVTAAPPQFDPVAYVKSVDRLLAADFRTLYLTHFGAVTDVAAHLTTYRARIAEVHQNVATWMAEGAGEQELRTRYHDHEHARALADGVSEADWRRCEQGNITSMCADGVRLFCAKAK
ncbi:MAG: MBL fold metallo-hydrolase [Verrucomicrobiaceae bacterium]|nr:MBL fold metallo-hydrolase [Verrucomicrobiaceae bacterium]